MLDYIIIGQGIAGTTLAFYLLEQGYSIKIIDNNPPLSSSKIASGLWNPIVLKRMKKVWLADEMLGELEKYYSQLEYKLNTKFIDHNKIIRAFNSPEEVNNWQELSDSQAFANILTPDPKPNHNNCLTAPFGFGEVQQSGRIDVAKMLLESRKWFLKHNLLETVELDYSNIVHTTGAITINKTKAYNIIFCEGHKAIHNPWFNYLPFALTKGEILIGQSEELKLNQPLNGGKFILPLSENEYKVGATYDWHNLNEDITDKGETELLNGWKKITSAPFKTTSHLAGIRPTVKDRRPLLGTHPEFRNLHIFNGLGSRGILMAPYLAQCFVKSLKDPKSLHPEMDINRF